MAELTDAERVFTQALRTVREKLMDTIMGLDDQIAKIEQTAAARPDVTERQRRLDRLGTKVRDLPNGGVQLRSISGQLINVAADGNITFALEPTRPDEIFVQAGTLYEPPDGYKILSARPVEMGHAVTLTPA